MHNVDTENAQSVETIYINGYEGLLIEKDARVHIVWGDTEQGLFVELVCTGLEKHIVIDMADAMKYVEN